MLKLMSKENKLALVLGFAFVLFVGILISDHFSTARKQEVANLTPQIKDPLLQKRSTNPDLIQFPAIAPTRTSPIETREPVRYNTFSEAIPQTAIVQPTPPQPEPKRATLVLGDPTPQYIGVSPQEAQQLPFTPHYVQPSETLSKICQKYYGDGSLVDDLARYNDIENPDHLRVGHRLRIPSAEVLLRGSPPHPTTQGNDTIRGSQQSKFRTYIVQPNDSLSTIAQRELGSAKRYLELYKFNRDVLDDPDSIRVGMKLKIPLSLANANH